MALDKNFLSKRFDPPTLTKKRIVTGIIVGLLYAFSFYGLLYLVREAFRVLSVSYYYEMLILSEREQGFFNLVFAFISVILGQSISFKIWYEKPRPAFANRFYRVRNIVNDQLLFIWVFLFWFGKMALAYGFMCVISIRLYRFHSLIYPEMNYIFILLIIVLFLQSWSSLRLVIRNSLKWMLLSAIVVSFISIAFSRINFIDTKVLNEVYTSKNYWDKYEIELPESKSGDFVRKLYATLDIFVHENSDNVLEFSIENEEFGIEELSNKRRAWSSRWYRNSFNLPKYRLIADKDIAMKHVNQIKKVLMQDTALFFSYAVLPKDREYSKDIYKYHHFRQKLHPIFNDSILSEFFHGVDTFSTVLRVDILKKGVLIDGKYKDASLIEESVKKVILSDPNYLIKLYCDDKVLYIKYMEVFSDIVFAIHEVRDSIALELYGNDYVSVTSKQQKEIKKIIPHRIMDISEEMLRFVNGEQATYYSD